jgi:hypothetical protein
MEIHSPQRRRERRGNAEFFSSLRCLCVLRRLGGEKAFRYSPIGIPQHYFFTTTQMLSNGYLRRQKNC